MPRLWVMRVLVVASAGCCNWLLQFNAEAWVMHCSTCGALLPTLVSRRYGLTPCDLQSVSAMRCNVYELL